MTVLAGAAPPARTAIADALYPIIGPGGGDVVAVRAGRRITRAAFQADVAALAARLPERRHVLNLCVDRYRFMVGFAAALCRRQISLLPPTDASAVLNAVAGDFPELYALVDTAARPPVPVFAYPDQLGAGAGAATVLPAIPGAQQALILFTSGSTGRPVPVPKTWGVLVRGARAAGARLAVTRLGAPTVIGTVPHQHSYGLESTILLGLQHGIAIESASLFFPADIRAALAAAGPCILVTTPVHLRALVAAPGGMPRAALILSATAPLPVLLAARAEACFSAPLLEIYGCTEAGQIATRRTVREEDWQCLEGVCLSARGGGFDASGPVVQGIAPLQDLIEPTGPGRFRLGGRAADLVDVAGKRTSLAHLNHLLLGIPGVADGVFFLPDRAGPPVTRLAALVVAPTLRRKDIMLALREATDAAFLPRPLVFVAALPRDALGKLPRAALLRSLRGGAPG